MPKSSSLYTALSTAFVIRVNANLCGVEPGAATEPQLEPGDDSEVDSEVDEVEYLGETGRKRT